MGFDIFMGMGQIDERHLLKGLVRSQAHEDLIDLCIDDNLGNMPGVIIFIPQKVPDTGCQNLRIILINCPGGRNADMILFIRQAGSPGVNKIINKPFSAQSLKAAMDEFLH